MRWRLDCLHSRKWKLATAFPRASTSNCTMMDTCWLTTACTSRLPGRLWAEVERRWGVPALTLVRLFPRAGPAGTSSGKHPHWKPRRMLWSNASEDIRALRRQVLDGGFGIGAGADLLAASLAVSKVENDSSGNTRLVKKGTNNTARDDISAGWILAAGAYDRMLQDPPKPPTVGDLI